MAARRPDRRRGPLAAIEALEPRLALATITFTDVDGDLVTVATSKGTDELLMASLTFVDLPLGRQLRKVDFSGPDFAGSSLSITARRVGGSGDGFVNVGEIVATDRDLGAVTVKGDLGRIRAGDANLATPAVKSLTVWSVGRLGTTTGAADLETLLDGAVGNVTVNGDVVNASVYINASPSVGKVVIRGSIIGGSADYSGLVSIFAAKVASVTIGGAVRGGVGLASGCFGAQFTPVTGPVTIGGGLWGGAGASSGSVSLLTCPLATVGGSIVGGSGAESGQIEITSDGPVTSLTVAGDIVGGTAVEAGSIVGGIDLLTVGGDIVGGTMLRTGVVAVYGSRRLTVGGSLFGGWGEQSGRISSTTGFDTVAVAGDVVGGLGDDSGAIRATFQSSVTKATIGGSVRGGAGLRSGGIAVEGGLGSAVIGGAIRGGDGFRSGSIIAAAVGTATVGRSVVGGVGAESGQISNAESVLGGLGVVTIGGSLVGGFGIDSGRVFAGSGATRSITVRGGLVGGFGQRSGVISASSLAQPTAIDVGSIESGLAAGSGGIKGVRVSQLRVRGAIRGTAARPVEIAVRGAAGAVPAIGSIVVGGSMERCVVSTVFAGDTGLNGHIGSVTVGGDMIATSIVSAVTNAFGVYGNDGDDWIDGNESAIGPVTVAGRIVGSAGVETFGIVARSLGPVKVADVNLGVPAAGSLVPVGSSNVRLHRLA